MPISVQDKQRVLDAAAQQQDWQLVACALSIRHQAAWRWVGIATQDNNWEAAPSQRGGRRYKRVTDEMKALLVARLEENCHLTLREMVEVLLKEYHVKLSAQTVKKAIGGVGFTIKHVHQQSALMNTLENKEKRYQYVVRLLELQSQGKKIYYVDETNYNVWCARMVGRSRRGDRVSKLVTASKGANMHVIACISSTGLEYWQRRFGSYKMPECKEFLRQLLSYIQQKQRSSDVVIVLDNAPCHSRAEQVFEEDGFSDATLLRLGPYSPMLNPIENVFSAVKAAIKQFLAAHRIEIIRQPVGMTIKAHREQFLVSAADVFVEDVITEELCQSCCAHTVGFHVPVCIFDDMRVGR